MSNGIGWQSRAAALLVTALCFGAVSAQTAADKQRNVEIGRAHDTAWALYDDLKKQAGGGQTLTWQNMPDWSGLWTRNSTRGNAFDTDRAPGELTSARLKPEAKARHEEAVRMAREGRLYDDALSECGPPGYPRWLAVPFLREFIVRPEQTWLSSETVNNVRRIYTDGRGHPPELERYPLYYGDSIGFWDDGRLIIHTTQLRASTYGRAHPEHSEQTETVEIWHKVADGQILADVWVYDPVNLEEPWYVQFRYDRVANDDFSLRMRYWNCTENPNNDVFETTDGSTQYSNFTFTSEDDR
jgi:hypothetical protein